MNISIIGLGKLGLPFAFFLASFKNKVFAYDKNKKIVNKIKKKKEFYIEPELNKYIKKFNKNVIIENSLEKVIKKSDITFLVLPTPSTKNGSFTNKYIESVLIKISKIIKRKKNKHYINITSTVNPNSCKNIFIPLLEKNGLKNHRDFFIIYNPHFIAQGSTLYNLKKPDVLLIGVDHKDSKKKIIEVYKKIYQNKKIYKILNQTEAEITKLSINSYITNKISFANYISEISDKLENVNAVKMLDAIGQDKRIGNSYLKLGTKFSGPCFPRDNKSLSFFSRTIRVNNILPKAVDAINERQTSRIINKIIEFKKVFNRKINLGILGITYKSNTDIILDSQSYDLVKKINKTKISIDNINYYDPYVEKKNYKIGNNVIFVKKSLIKLIKTSDIIIVMYKDYNFKNLEVINIKNKKVVIDCWNFINKLKKPFIYSRLGKKYIK